MENINETLKEITKVLLDPEDNFGEIKTAVDQLYDLLVKITGLEADSQESREDIFLPGGKAIGPIWAALCVREFMRTKRFVQGINAAIIEAKKTFPGRTINIIYAGTGPFATLILPLTTVFTSSDIQCTLLEINPESIKSLNKVISAFGIESYITEIVQCDAATYKADTARPVHIIFAEVMQMALRKEPQVAVTLNLAPQLEKGGIFIPENVKVDAAMMKMSNGSVESDYHCLGEVFCLDKDTVFEGTHKKTVIDIPDDIPLELNFFSLLTEVRVFGEYKLVYGQCSLTLPLRLFDQGKLNAAPKKVELQYTMSKEPHFDYEIY